MENNAIATNRLRLESFNGLNMSVDIISHRLKILQELLSLVDNSLVLEGGTVVGEVDGGGLGGLGSINPDSVGMALAESLEGRHSL